MTAGTQKCSCLIPNSDNQNRYCYISRQSIFVKAGTQICSFLNPTSDNQYRYCYISRQSIFETAGTQIYSCLIPTSDSQRRYCYIYRQSIFVTAGTQKYICLPSQERNLLYSCCISRHHRMHHNLSRICRKNYSIYCWNTPQQCNCKSSQLEWNLQGCIYRTRKRYCKELSL